MSCHQPTNGHSWRRGRQRFWIEPTWRDWKSYGFDLAHSQSTHAQRLHRLLLGMVLATRGLLLLGQWLQHTGGTSVSAVADAITPDAAHSVTGSCLSASTASDCARQPTLRLGPALGSSVLIGRRTWYGVATQ